MKKLLSILILVTILSCKEKKRAFRLNPVLQKTIGGSNLKPWLQKASFTGEWNPYNNASDEVIITTNIEQIFPFKGKFENENGNFSEYSLPNSDVYSKEAIIFKDPKWGELFVQAMLTYESDDLYKKDSYDVRSNPLTNPIASANLETHEANLRETLVYSKNDTYKTAIYWVSTGWVNEYIYGFYQQNQLVFEIAFPCSKEEPEKGLKKLNEVAKDLGLSINEWKTATVDSLQINYKPRSFWRNPYYGLFPKEDYTNNSYHLYLKLKNTPFKAVDNQEFALENKQGKSLITVKTLPVGISKTLYYDAKTSVPKYSSNKFAQQKVFVTEQEDTAGYINGKAETYYKNDSILKFTYNYPKTDTLAKHYINDMLKNIWVISKTDKVD